MNKPLLFLLAFGALLATAAAEKIDLGADAPAAGKSGRYVTKNGSNDELLITLLPALDEHMGDLENLRAMAEIATAQFVSGSVEGQANLKETKFGGVTGLAVSFTDASLVGKPASKGDYKAVTSCFFLLSGKLMVTATIFTDDLKGSAHAEALQVVKSLSLTTVKDKL